MKQRISIVLTLVMLLGLLAGCAGTTVVVGNCTCPTEPVTGGNSTPAPTIPADGSALKTGLAVIAAPSLAAGEGNTTVEFDVTLVAVTVDDNGVIHDCVLDSVKASADVDTTGNIVSDLSAEVKTKNELGEAYGMKAYAGSKYEWNEQAAAIAAYAVGKTADELKNGAVTETGHAADADLYSTATIYIGGYVDAICAAAENSQHLGAVSGDELKFAAVPTLSGSVSATAEKNGTVQLDCDVTALTMNGDTITSCAIDALQAKVSFDAAGAIVTDLTQPMQTKNQLGEAYGMKAYAGSKYEWNEQAANFAAYVTGKTPAEVAGIAVNEKTAPTDADLASSVTIAIGGFQALLAKAAN